MAPALGISERAVEGRLESAIKTLRARNRTHAVAIALRNKLVE
jgi:DNA-binding NarL/FixJ family response regulator